MLPGYLHALTLPLNTQCHTAWDVIEALLRAYSSNAVAPFQTKASIVGRPRHVQRQSQYWTRKRRFPKCSHPCGPGSTRRNVSECQPSTRHHHLGQESSTTTDVQDIKTAQYVRSFKKCVGFLFPQYFQEFIFDKLHAHWVHF